MSSAYPSSEAMNGAEVFGADGEKVGTVSAVYPSYIVVAKGLFFPTDYFIPTSAIASSDNDQIYLNVARDGALNSGWDAQPLDLETTMDYSTAMPSAGVGMTDAVVGSARVAGADDIIVPLMEEELTATVRQQEAGSVRVEKEIVTEERTIDVPVVEERVRVERRVVDRAVTAADGKVMEQVTIDVPLRGEVVDVQKQARVTGEVVISKDAVQRTERVTDTVRKEEVYIDEEGTADSALIERSGQGSSQST